MQDIKWRAKVRESKKEISFGRGFSEILRVALKERTSKSRHKRVKVNVSLTLISVSSLLLSQLPSIGKFQ